MKKLTAIVICLVLTVSLVGCDLNPLINLLKGRYKSADEELSGTLLEDGTTLYYSKKVSDDALVSISDESGTVFIDNDDIHRVEAKFSELNGYHIQIKLTTDGAASFFEATKQNIGKKLNISVDGTVLSSPTVYDEIETDEFIIANNQSDKELLELFDALTK